MWRLNEKLLERAEKENVAKVTWIYQHDSEFMDLAQLKTLLDTYCDYSHLDMPYVPYARQDKRVSNRSTFAFTTFAKLLNSLHFSMVTTLDAHCIHRIYKIKNCENKLPHQQVYDTFAELLPSHIAYPDQGAANRYRHAYQLPVGYVLAEKTRNPDNGNVEGLQIVSAPYVDKASFKHALIIDDICDGGATFKAFAHLLKTEGFQEVSLFVTHGLFTKGVETLREAGIKRIFTYKGEVK